MESRLIRTVSFLCNDVSTGSLGILICLFFFELLIETASLLSLTGLLTGNGLLLAALSLVSTIGVLFLGIDAGAILPGGAFVVSLMAFLALSNLDCFFLFSESFLDESRSSVTMMQ